MVFSCFLKSAVSYLSIPSTILYCYSSVTDFETISTLYGSFCSNALSLPIWNYNNNCEQSNANASDDDGDKIFCFSCCGTLTRSRVRWFLIH